MLILNFSHPLTPEQVVQIEAATGAPVARIVDHLAQLDHGQPFAAQAGALADAMGLSAAEWQTIPLLVNLPGYAPAAVCLITEIHGRAGYFPAILRLRPTVEATPVRYEVAEIVNLQQVRDAARLRRYGE